MKGQMKSHQKIYRGVRTKRDGCVVTVNFALLDPYHDVMHCSGTKGGYPGFEWGYFGAGPSQLAVALLADWLGNAKRALRYLPEFRHRVTAKLLSDSWELSGEKIEQVLSQIENDDYKESKNLNWPPPPFRHLTDDQWRGHGLDWYLGTHKVVADAAGGVQEWYDDWAIHEVWLEVRGLPPIPEDFKMKRKQEKEIGRRQLEAIVSSPKAIPYLPQEPEDDIWNN